MGPVFYLGRSLILALRAPIPGAAALGKAGTR